MSQSRFETFEFDQDVDELALSAQKESQRTIAKSKTRKKRKASINVSDIDDQSQNQDQNQTQNDRESSNDSFFNMSDEEKRQHQANAFSNAMKCLHEAILFEQNFEIKQKVQIEISNIQNIEARTNNIIQQKNDFDISNNNNVTNKQIQQQLAKINKRFDKVEMNIQNISKNKSNVQNSYAQVAANNVEKSNFDFNSRSTSSSKTSTASISYRDRRLILTNSKINDSTLSSIELREKINQEFKRKLSIEKSVVAAITKSQRNENVVLTTTEHFSADYLSSNQSIWQSFFDFSKSYKDKTWHKVIVHGIPTDIFNRDDEMIMLHDEIITFNHFQSLAINWLSTKENRDTKKHASIIISLESKELATKLLSKRVMIAGLPLRTQEFEERKSNEQCQKCQKFGHDSRMCKNEIACQLCAENHVTRLHNCKSCSVIDTTCTHSMLKCVNCNQNHRANSKECEIYINALQKTSRKSSQKSIARQSQNRIKNKRRKFDFSIIKW